MLSTLTLAACANNSSNAEGNIVTGENIAISNEDFMKELKDTAGESILSRMILTELFTKEVGEPKYKQLDQAADAAVKTSKAQIGEDGFNNLLQQMGVGTEEDYQNNLLFYSLMNEVLPNYIEITDEELKQAYEDYQPETEVSHILVDDEEKAKELIERAKNGEDFAELAKENSTDDQTKDNGGSLGKLDNTGIMQLQEPFRNAMKDIEVGQIGDEPVQTSFGYHVIKIDSREDKPALDNIRDDLQKQITAQKAQQDNVAVTKALKKLVDKYKVEVTDDDLKSVMDQFDPEKVQQNPLQQTPGQTPAPAPQG